MERRRKRIRGRRALRPLVLCGAMLAPALLAAGLLTAELTGYGPAAKGGVAEPKAVEGAGDGEGGGDGAPVALPPLWGPAMEPRIVPPPTRPDRIYGGWAPPVAVVDAHRSAARDVSLAHAPPVVRRVAPRKTPAPRVRRAPQSERPKPGFGCPDEWRDTWLWEVCKEKTRQTA